MKLRYIIIRILIQLGPIGLQLASQLLLGTNLPEFDRSTLNKANIVRINQLDTNLKNEIKLLIRAKKNVDFSEEAFENLYPIAIKCFNNQIDKSNISTELERVLSINSGGADVGSGLFLAIVIIMLKLNNGFQPGQGQVVPPHLEWLFGSNHNQNGQQTSPNGKGDTSRGPASLQVGNQEVIEQEQYPDAITGIANDEKPVTVTMEQTRKKGYHMCDFLTNREISENGGDPDAIKKYSSGKSPFSDKTLEKDGDDFKDERSKYFKDERNVPERLIRLFAQRLVDFCRRTDVQSAPGLMGWKEIPGTVFVNGPTRTVAFRDQNGEIKSGCQLGQPAFRDFLTGEKVLHLYPNAGKPENK